MPEIGLVQFAHTAMSVLKEKIPEFRTKFSKHVFSQPQLLAILCLMRYEGWTFRETKVRLREHGELCAALELARVPDHTTLYRFMRRVDRRSLMQFWERQRCASPAMTVRKAPWQSMARD